MKFIQVRSLKRTLQAFNAEKSKFFSKIILKDMYLDKHYSGHRYIVRQSKYPRIEVRNRCVFTGRSRAVFNRFKMSRFALKKLGSKGMVHGLKKSSW